MVKFNVLLKLIYDITYGSNKNILYKTKMPRELNPTTDNKNLYTRTYYTTRSHI